MEKPSDVLKVGDEIVAKVTELNAADKKISLSIKALNAPERREEPKEEDVVSVYTDTEDEEIEEAAEELAEAAEAAEEVAEAAEAAETSADNE